MTGLYPTQTIVAHGTPLARISTAVYDFYTGLPTSSTDVDNGVTNATEYDALGRPVKAISALGVTGLESWTQTEYNDVERRVVVRSDLEAIGDGKKVAVQFFDQLGRVRLAKTLEDAATQSATNETDGIKVQTRYRSNPLSSLGLVGEYTLVSNPYRAPNSSAASTEPTMGWTVEFESSTSGLKTIETFNGSALPSIWGGNTDSTGKSEEREEANAVVTIDESGRTRRTVADALGRMIRVDEPNGDGVLGSLASPHQATNYSYDTLGNLLQIVQGGQTRTFTYSSLSRLLSATNPESGTFQYTYDPNGNLLTKTDARSITTTYSYDALNRVTFRNYSDATPDITYTYDDPQVPFSKGKLTKVASSVSETHYLGFDSQGRVTGSRQRTDGRDYDFGYTYYLGGDPKTQTYPSGKVVEFGYDASGDLAQVSKQAGGGSFVYANSFVYAPHGVVEKVRLGNGKWESTAFNGSRQITQVGLGHSAADTGLWKINYEYGEWEGQTLNAQRNNGNLARQTITVPTIGTATGFTAVQTYSYDSLDRLKSAAETIGGNLTWKQTFLYDRFGNKNFDTGNTTLQSSESAVAKITNPEILASNNKFKEDQDGDSQPDYLYDLSGNVTKNAREQYFTYDAENRQITATGTGLATNYFYDPNGKRVKSHNAVSGQTTVFVYDAESKLAAEYTINVPAPTVPTISYLTEDALGSVRVTTNSFGEVKARRDYLPFGEELFAGLAGRNANQKYSSSTDDTRKKFATYQRDAETGLDYAQSRYYSPVNGRFTSPDEFKGGPDELFDFEEDASDNPTFYADLENPQSLNKYQYTYNNPYKYNDPDGHIPVCPGCFLVRPAPVVGPAVAPKPATIIRPVINPGPVSGTLRGRLGPNVVRPVAQTGRPRNGGTGGSNARNPTTSSNAAQRGTGRRRITVRHPSKKRAREAAEHPRPGKKLPQPKKDAPKVKREAYKEQQKYKRPESHPNSKHPKRHFHDRDKSKEKVNRHHTFPGSE